MFLSRLLLKSSVLTRRLAKGSPVFKRHLNRLSLNLALKAVSRIANEPRPCAGGCRCGRG